MCGERQRATFYVWRAKRATFPCGERSEPPSLHIRSRPRPRVGGWRAWAGTSAALPALGGHAVRLAAQGWQGCTTSLGSFGGRAVRPHGIGAEQHSSSSWLTQSSCCCRLPLLGCPIGQPSKGKTATALTLFPALLAPSSRCCRLPSRACPSGHAQEGKTTTALTLKANNE